jgi:4-hydroxy-3-methylbut-2-enyl diphosphate reductase IspH
MHFLRKEIVHNEKIAKKVQQKNTYYIKKKFKINRASLVALIATFRAQREENDSFACSQEKYFLHNTGHKAAL